MRIVLRAAELIAVPTGCLVDGGFEKNQVGVVAGLAPRGAHAALKSRVGNLGAGELGDGLGALGHGVLGELTREDEADRGLHLAGREGGLLVVAGELAGLGRDALEDVVDERVHDGHAALGDAGVGVHLLEHLVDVDRVRLGAALLALAALGLLLC